MKKRDARTGPPTAQEAIRRQAVSLHDQGLSYVKIAQQLEIHRHTVSSWVRRYPKEGMASLKSQKRGRPWGCNMQRLPREQRKIRRGLIDKDPQQMKRPFALWTREAIAIRIEKKTGKQLDLPQIGRYLKRGGFTPQRPVKQAYQPCDKKVSQWLEKDYPDLHKRAIMEGAQIHWADETGIKRHDHRGRGYALKGSRPVRKHNPSYEKVNMLSAVTNQGKLRFSCYEGSFTYPVFHRFLKGLIAEAKGQKIYVVLDNLRVHPAQAMKRWARRYNELIELHYLPSYSPDLNPDDYLNCDLKPELSKRPERSEKGRWRTSVENTLEEFTKQPERIKSYFQAKPIKYAA